MLESKFSLEINLSLAPLIGPIGASGFFVISSSLAYDIGESLGP